MRFIFSIAMILFSVNVFSQIQISPSNYADMTHWGNYNPPDDPAVDTGWLIVGCFFYLHNGGGGPILSANGIGIYYDTRKFVSDVEGRIREHRRILHKHKLKIRL